MGNKECLVVECGRSAHHRDGGRNGFCSVHYQRNKKHGDPLTKLENSKPAYDWLRAHVDSKSDECIKWPFATGKDGYGRVHDRLSENKVTTASRLMCIMAHGLPPFPNSEAAHSCGKGNQACTNPNHLYWATPVQNQSDRVVHGTSNRGARQWRSKLKEQDVLRIRELLSTETQVSIAKIFSVHPSVISDIKHGKLWGWLK